MEFKKVTFFINGQPIEVIEISKASILCESESQELSPELEGLMNEIHEMHRLNAIDKALDTGDREMFMKLGSQVKW